MTDARAEPHPAAPKSGPLLDRAVRLFSFLGQAQQLRTPTVHDLDAHRTDGSVHWLHELPDHEAVHRAPAVGTDVFSVERLARPDPPRPDSRLAAWLDGPVDDAGTPPRLRERRTVTAAAGPCPVPDPVPGPVTVPGTDPVPGPLPAAVPSAVTGPDRPPTSTELTLADHPEITAAHQDYLLRWKPWAERVRRDDPVRAYYSELFATYVRATGHPEELEAVLGVGLLAWRPDGGHPAVRRHLLTTPVALSFDDNSGRLTVAIAANAEGQRVELDMLEPGLLGSPQAVHAVRERARDNTEHPLHREYSGELARRLVHLLSPDAEYREDDLAAVPAEHPVAVFAPALILRRRTQQGLVDVFERIVEQITANGVVPAGVLPLVDPDHVPPAGDPAGGERCDGAVVRVEDELFLPLPVNDTQLRILRRVDQHAQTVIQGPPGTGKTHTAAVLIAHLLAKGKRVLVTAQTDRALKEVRSKLPDAIRPLAVSVVGAAREDMAELRVAVERLGNTAAEHDHADAERAIAEHLAAIDRLSRDRAALRNRLIEARELEVRENEVAGYRGSRAAIAARVAQERDELGWLTDPVAPQPPMTSQAIMRWHELLTDPELAADAEHAGQRLVEEADVPGPDRFAELVSAEGDAARATERHADLQAHPSLPVIERLPRPHRDALATDLQRMLGELRQLEQRREPWVGQALDDLRHGRPGPWQARLAQLGDLLTRATAAIGGLDAAADVRIDGDRGGLEQLARPLLDHLAGGNQLKLGSDGRPKMGMLTARVVKQAAPVFERVRVSGAVPTTAAQLDAVLRSLAGERFLDGLDRSWPAAAQPPVGAPHERLHWHVAEFRLLERVLALDAELGRLQQRGAAAGLPPIDFADPAGIATLARLPEAITAAEAAEAAGRPLEQLAARLTEAAGRADAAPVLGQLLAAVLARNGPGYADAHERLAALHRVRELLGEREQTGRRLGCAAPQLAEAVLADPSDPGWRARLARFERAWAWASADAWLDERDRVDLDRLQRQIRDAEDGIRDHVKGLAAARAWSHAVARLSQGARADLEQYAALVRRFGKTGGQYREQRRAEIRDAMIRCRPAVPVWIMPLYRIADQLRIEPEMFDVVIVDEASQAGTEAMFLQYLAPRMVVIGDDKQVSPAAVGVDQQQLRDLAGQYLFDDRFKATWQDPQRSLFDEARMRFSGMLTLTEHRRCVPEIIEFSNRIAYEPDGVRLIPVRQFGPDRLDPIRPVLVRDGYERGSSVSRVNPPEIDAIVAQVLACLADERYDGLTFGVISLLGPGQAKAIERKLLDRVPPEEWVARDLRCGDAADFQGSERDVVFLSMVAAPGPDRRLTALTTPPHVQRYNVAASRARDQMWVFHSVPLERLTNPEDMRFQLLDYCYGVARRASGDDDRVVAPALPEDERVEPFGSLFEQRVCNRVTGRGYAVVPQYPALGYRIDLVVIGASARLAIECDGDFWHGPDAYQRDLARQRELERCDWSFFRVLESDFVRDPAAALSPLWAQLGRLEIHPSGWVPPGEAGAEAERVPEPPPTQTRRLGPGQQLVVPTGRLAIGTDAAGVDLSAFLLGQDGRVRGDADFVFYNQPSTADGSVRHGVAGGAEGLTLAPDLIATQVERVLVAASTDSGKLGENLTLTVAPLDAADHPARSEIVLDATGETAVVCAELQRTEGGWRLRALCRGHRDGLAGLADDLGVTVD